MLFFPHRYCCHSVAILYFIAHMPHCCFIEFPDYSLTVSKCFIHVQYKYISLLCCIFFLSLSDSLLRLIACVTQLNLITFVGLAEWIAEMNNYRFNTEKYYQKFNWTMNWSNRQKQTHTHKTSHYNYSYAFRKHLHLVFTRSIWKPFSFILCIHNVIAHSANKKKETKTQWRLLRRCVYNVNFKRHQSFVIEPLNLTDSQPNLNAPMDKFVSYMYSYVSVEMSIENVVFWISDALVQLSSFHRQWGYSSFSIFSE